MEGSDLPAADTTRAQNASRRNGVPRRPLLMFGAHRLTILPTRGRAAMSRDFYAV